MITAFLSVYLDFLQMSIFVEDFYWRHYKELLKKTGLSDIRWHDLRSTYCTLLLMIDMDAYLPEKKSETIKSPDGKPNLYEF